MGDEFKKYDSEDRFEQRGVVLTKDAEVREGANGKMVRLSFVSTSRTEGDSDLWVEANVADRQADLAACLKKGDTLHVVEGKPCLRRWVDKEGKNQISFNVRRASFVMPRSMWATVKERGFSPSAGKDTKPPGRFGKQAPPQTRREPDPLDDDMPF